MAGTEEDFRSLIEDVVRPSRVVMILIPGPPSLTPFLLPNIGQVYVDLKDLRQLASRGIPNSARPDVWLYLSHVASPDPGEGFGSLPG